MKKHLLLLTAIITLTYTSCKEEKKAPTGPTQMQQVMAIHDEVMPKMGEIGKLVSTLKPLIDSTESGMKYEKAMKDLQNANKSMMDWMQGFGSKFDSDEILNGKELSAEKQNLLNEEEESVKEVANLINTSIANAETLLKK
ncbi:hypothetical protein CLV91_1148 [Maribacter vaceletii]|uniref:Viral A-type inclusion protein n=1 Tax=Maribacter vaceletii TaxID=1206816 RepID=A0A495EE95_9FLAO|nr:hypothetical protein [Maribacter vaceletii]RKR15066.1 hypothetical protein CLV91_1148 [Maribacter vaceletii]